jgi:hypothetical protein
MAWTRDDWNNIIQQVNEVLQNPPADTDCEAQPTLDEVSTGHLWSKDDIREVQDALKETCDDISFDTIPDLWKQSIIDEINTAIGQAWCNCEPEEDECTPTLAHSEDGMEIVLYDNGPPKVVSDCIGTNTPDILLKDLVNGVTFGIDQVFSRIWRVFRRNIRNDGGTSLVSLATGVLNCHGVASYLGTATVSTAAGIGVGCFDCSSEGCATALADAASHLGDPEIFYNQYVLVIDSTGAVCARPGDCP